MLTRRHLLTSAAGALALVAAPKCGPTNPPQRVFIGRFDMGQDLHGSDPDPLLTLQMPSEAEIADWTRKAESMARDLGERPRTRDAKVHVCRYHEGYDLRPGPLPPGLEALLPRLQEMARRA